MAVVLARKTCPLKDKKENSSVGIDMLMIDQKKLQSR